MKLKKSGSIARLRRHRRTSSGPASIIPEELEGRVLFSGGLDFAGEKSFPVGNGANGAVVADFTGAGKADLAVTNSKDGDVIVLGGNGDGTFRQADGLIAEDLNVNPFPVPQAIAAADINGDGFPDLVVAGNDDTISVFLGNGNGVFKAPITTHTGPADPGFLTLADINGDGFPDVIMTDDADHCIVILFGNGDGTFTAPEHIVLDGAPTAVAIADLNHDGLPDLIVSDNEGAGIPGTVQVVLSNTMINETPEVIRVGIDPQSVAVADINGDGNPDIVTANTGDNTISVLQGNGDGTFAAPRTYATGSMPESVKIADINGDGDPDILVMNAGDSTLGIFRGVGDGTFLSQQTMPTGGGSVLAVGDFNGDGELDIATVDPGANSVNIFTNQTSKAVVNSLLDVDFVTPGSTSAGQSGAAEIGAAGDGWNNQIIQSGSVSESDLPVSPPIGSISPIELGFTAQSGANDNNGIFTGTPYAGLMSNYLIADPREGSFDEPGPPGTVTLSGLTPGADYNLYLYSGADAAGRATVFTVGNIHQTATSDPNVNYLELGVNFAQFTDIPANDSGAIAVSFDSFNGGQADFSGLQLAAYKPQTTTDVTSSANPASLGSTVTFTATITPSNPAATGTVAFYNGTTPLGTPVNVVNGMAQVTFNSSVAGTSDITADYSGDATHGASDSSVFEQTYAPIPASVTTLTSSANPATVGASVAFTAAVAPAQAGGPTPAGTITFYDGAAALGAPVMLSNGVAVYSSQTLSPGVYNISAIYTPAGVYSASTSQAVSQTINAVATTTTFTSSSNPGAAGASIALTATVTSANASLTPTGMATFFDGATQIGSVALTDGLATLDISSLADGMHSITVNYGGDSDHGASSSTPLNQSILTPQLSANLVGPSSSSFIAGALIKLHEKLTLTANNGAVAGSAAATILLSPTLDAADGVLTLATAGGNLKLKAGQGKNFNLHLPKSIPSSVAAGMYHVLIKLTDTAGNTFTLDSGQSINVVAPVVDLAGSFSKIPTVVVAGKRFAVSIVITNAGAANVAATGVLPIDIETSADGQLSDAAALLTMHKPIKLRPGASMKITFTTSLSATTYLVVNLDPGNAVFANDSNPSNNTFIGKIVVG